MNAYYQRLADIRVGLLANGKDQLALELLKAERAASTSGEALARTGVVLRRILDQKLVDDPALMKRLQSADDEGTRLWQGGQPQPPLK